MSQAIIEPYEKERRYPCATGLVHHFRSGRVLASVFTDGDRYWYDVGRIANTDRPGTWLRPLGPRDARSLAAVTRMAKALIQQRTLQDSPVAP